MNSAIIEVANFTTVTGTVNSPVITLNPSSGQVGTTVTVSGSGFLASDVACSVSGYPATNTMPCTVSGGILSATFTVANVASGPWTITATGSPGSDFAEATFTVTVGASVATITLSPNSGYVGTFVMITGSGFNVADTYCSITSSLGASMISNVVCTMSDGVITSASFTVGTGGTAGSYAIITLTGNLRDSASATFTLTGGQTTVAVAFEEDGLGSDAIGNVIQIDGAWYDYQQLAAGVTLSWLIGSTHTISANTLISGTNGNQYNFEYWSDDGASTHTITVTGAAEYVAYYSLSSSGQVNNEITITETMRTTTTSLTTVTKTTTGYATTEISSVTTSETLYTTELQTSYGTITVTTYVYIESNSPSQQLTNSTNANSTNGGSLLQQLSQQLSLFLQLPRPTFNSGPMKFVPIAIAGAGIVAGASVTVRRRRRGNKKGPEEGSAGVGSGEIDGRVMDYIAAHQGAISMGQATEDLGISPEDLTGAIEKLKADGRLKAT
jgi:hypothetical protein